MFNFTVTSFLAPYFTCFFLSCITLLGFRQYFKDRLKPSVISPADNPTEGLAGRVADAG